MTGISKTNKCLALLKQWEIESKELAVDKRRLEEELRANPNMEYRNGQFYMIESRETQIRNLSEFGKQLARALGGQYRGAKQ